MIIPQKPKDETERLKALHNLNILDTRAEERFDRVTRFAQHIFHVPIASVSFVDKEREWFKSNFGLQIREMPREISFGSHVILQEKILIVQDALNDIRFRDNPLVTGRPNIRFYLGCPLKSKEQFNIGTLCLINDKLQQFTEVDLNVIKELATTIESEFDVLHRATIDELTQLSNRKGFTALGTQIIKLSKEYDKNLLLLYFDLNQFKFINNIYGENEEEKTLKIFAQQLLKNFRHSDAIARTGKDTFCILCSGLNKKQLPIVLKRLQNKLSAAHPNYTIEFNMGSIQYDSLKHYSINALIEDADEQIYEHKKNYH